MRIIGSAPPTWGQPGVPRVPRVEHPGFQEDAMTKVIKCDCGFVVRGDTDEELVAAATEHAREVHGMELTADQILAMAEPA
jgi:predicted small metal-binding protein